MAYNSDSIVQTLATALANDPKAVAQKWASQMREGARSVDDFSQFEGSEGSGKPFVVRSDLSGTGAGQTVIFNVMSQPKGGGARGETELRGNESTVDFQTFACMVDFWRDAIAPTKKELQFLAASGNLKAEFLKMLSAKLGRRRMNDMKMMLLLQGVGNTIYPNGRKTVASLNALDTLTPSGITNAVPQWRRIGGQAMMVKSKQGSPVYKPLVYIPDAAIASIKNSTSYETAATFGGDQDNESNAMFSGKLLDWNGVGLFEHVSVDPEGDQAADPLAPRALQGVAFGSNSAIGDCKLRSDTVAKPNLKVPYMAWLGGYAYQWFEGQATDTCTQAPGGGAWANFYTALGATVNYAWLVNPDGSVGFVRWTGSGNNGNQITLTGILDPNGALTSTIGSATLGNMVATGDAWGYTGAAYVRAVGGAGATSNCSSDSTWASDFDAGAYIIPCNTNGAVNMNSLMLGKNSAVRAYVGDDVLIQQPQDYGFVMGGGYESIFGQAPCIRTDFKTPGYSLLKHAGQHPGLEVPTLSA